MSNTARDQLALAVRYLQIGRSRDAEELAGPLVTDPVTEHAAQRLLGLIAEQDGDHEAAAALIEQSLSGLQGLDHTGGLRDLARVLTTLGDNHRAAFFSYNAGVSLYNISLFDQAHTQFVAAATLDPKNHLYVEQRCKSSLRMATEMKAQWRQAQIECAIACLEYANLTNTQWDEARDSWEGLPDTDARATVFLALANSFYARFNPDDHDPDVFMNLFSIFEDHLIDQESVAAVSLAAYMCVHTSSPDHPLHFKLIDHWWKWNKRTLTPPTHPISSTTRRPGPLRLGIMDYSSVFHMSHYVFTSFIESFRAFHRGGIDLFLYTAPVISGESDLATACKALRSFSAWNEDVVRPIMDDELDILLVPNGFLQSFPFDLLIQPLARKKAVWHHTHTTFGPDLFDATIYDPNLFSDDHRAVSFETPIVSDRLPLLFAAPREAPPVQDAPRHRLGRISFGVFNRPTKFHPRLVQAWAEILARVPNSRLVFACAMLHLPSLRGRMERLLDGAGISQDQIVIMPPTASHRDYLEGYREIDISLDCSPFNGGMVTFESLWQGVPVVSCYGDGQLSRSCLAFLRPVGLGDLAAPDFDAYVDTAVRLASDGDRLDSIRTTMRERLQQSTMMNAEGYVDSMMRVFDQILALPDKQWSPES
ncbi:MAG: hypothetical protein EAZ99_10535 [Alphaproteobacteria bacterium]|nr:MAG: hypothetical protein EAZ99_10535 [Alphaproteobacteria bacterium]